MSFKSFLSSSHYQSLQNRFFVSRYKQRCDEMRRQYDTRLANFYEEHPTLRPVKPDKAKKALVRIYLELKINKHGSLIEMSLMS